MDPGNWIRLGFPIILRGKDFAIDIGKTTYFADGIFPEIEKLCENMPLADAMRSAVLSQEL